jgi:tetratricopeptide (TPR) repeat protein
MNKFTKIKLLMVLLAGLIVLSGCRPKELESTVMAMQRQNYDDALQFAEKAVQTYPENTEAWFYYGFLMGEHKKDYVEMNKAFDKALSLNPEQKVSFAGGQVAAKDAINQIRLAKFAENYNGGVKLIQEGQNATDEAKKKEYYAKAKEKLALATEIAPARPEPYRPLAMTSIFLGDTTGAEKALQMGLEKLPNDEMMVIAAAEVYTMTGNFDKAEEMLKKALEINPNNSDAYQKLGLIEASRKNWDKANEYYQKAMALDPDNVDLAYNIGVSLYNQQKTDDALPYFLKAYTAEPDNEIITNILANCYVRSQTRVDEGIEFMKKLTEQYPDNPTYWEYLAILYGNKGMSKEANEAFKKSQELKNK